MRSSAAQRGFGGCRLRRECSGKRGTRADVEFLEDVREVRFDGELRHVQPLGDLAVPVAPSGQPGDAVFGGRECSWSAERSAPRAGARRAELLAGSTATLTYLGDTSETFDPAAAAP
jgi:hypothetical protein